VVDWVEEVPFQDSAGGFNVENDARLHIDQVVVGEGEEGRALNHAESMSPA
jgi:hypothetical protein